MASLIVRSLPRTKEGGPAARWGVRTQAGLAVSVASIKVAHCAAECMSDTAAKTNGALSHRPR